MTYLIFGGLSIWSLLKKNSKKVTVIWVLFACVLATYNLNLADRGNYLAMYRREDLMSRLSEFRIEIGFRWIMRLANAVGMDFNCFIFLITLCSVLICLYIIQRYTNYFNICMLFFILFPFCIDACQIRTLLADALIILGLRFLEEKNMKNILFYCLCVLAAFLMHRLALFFAVFLLFFLVNKGRKFVYANIGLLTGVLILQSNGWLKMQIGRIVPSAVSYLGGDMEVKFWGYVLLIGIVMFFFFLLYQDCHDKQGNYIGTIGGTDEHNEIRSRFWELAYFINLIFLWVIPFIYYSRQFGRLVRVFMVVDYISFCIYLEGKKRKKRYSNGIYISVCLLIVLFAIYITCGSVIRETYGAIFSDNYILN